MTSYFADMRQCGLTYQNHPVVACSSELVAILGTNPLPKITDILASSYQDPHSQPPRRIGNYAYLTERGVTRVRIECQLRRDGWGLLIAQDTAELTPTAAQCHESTECHASSSSNTLNGDQL